MSQRDIYSKTNTIYFLFMTGVVLLPLSTPINLFFQGSILTIWKQALSALLTILSVLYLARSSHWHKNIRYTISVILCVASVVIMWMFTSYVGDNLSAQRVLYAVFAYIGFLPYILLPAIAIKRGKFHELIKLYSLVAVICGVGLILDYFLNITGILYATFGADTSNIAVERYGFALIRASFPFESPSTGYGFLSIGMIFNYIAYIHSKKLAERTLFILGMATIFVGCILTATRAIWVLITIIILSIVFIELKRMFRYRKSVLLLLCLVTLLSLGKNYFPDIEQADILLERALYATSYRGEANEFRFNIWRRGMDMVGTFDSSFFFGHGLGSTMGQINDGFRAHTHYESSFFQAFYEGGVVGIFVRYFWYLVALAGLMRGGAGDSRVNILLSVWLFLYFLATATSPTAGAYHGQMALFTVVGMTMLWPYYGKTSMTHSLILKSHLVSHDK